MLGLVGIKKNTDISTREKLSIISSKKEEILKELLCEFDEVVILNTCNGISKTRTIKSSELIEIIEARVEEIFALINKDITLQANKSKINNVILTGQGITNINKSDVAGKIALNIPVKMSTGRLISTIRPSYRTAYALVRYIAARPFVKSVSSSIDTVLEDNFLKVLLERIKEFFYS